MTAVKAVRHDVPGAGLAMDKMPGHWLLAQLGKRVLRPGGLELTERMLSALRITPDDHVVELAPGLGTTARLTLERGPASYVAVERDEVAAEATRRLVSARGPSYTCVRGSASQTGLEPERATVVYGEAMLTMQTPAGKGEIVREALRLLKPGGRYGIHELALTPDELDPSLKDEVQRELSEAIHVGARPLTLAEWREALEREGFEVAATASAPMHLLEPRRLLRDEGLRGMARIAWNLARNPVARCRVRAMRELFARRAELLCAVMLVAEKPRR